MSFFTVREEIASVASTVFGVTGLPYHRQTTKVGDAVVRLGSINYPNTFGGIVTWEVVVSLHQEPGQAEKFIEEITPSLVEALGRVFTVRRVYPARASFDNATTNVLVIEGTREDD